MQLDLLRSGHDLDLRPNFQHGLVKWIIVHSRRLDNRNMMLVKSIWCLYWVKGYYRNTFRKNCYFLSFFLSLEAKLLILGQTLGHLSERALKELAIECAFPRRCISSGSRIMCRFLEKCWKAKFDVWWYPVTWPLIWPKKWPNQFRHEGPFECRLPHVAIWSWNEFVAQSHALVTISLNFLRNHGFHTETTRRHLVAG